MSVKETDPMQARQPYSWSQDLTRDGLIANDLAGLVVEIAKFPQL